MEVGHHNMLGKKIQLRALELKDVSNFHTWENEADAMEHSGYLQPMSAYTAERFIEHANRPVEETGQLRLMIETLNGQAVGLMDIFEIDFIHRTAGLGVLIAREFRQQGLGTEAIGLMCHHAFTRLNLELVYADIRADHTASLKAFSNAGFNLSVSLPAWRLYEGRRVDVIRKIRLFSES